MGGVDLSVKMLAGTKFPGPEGGHFHGIGIEPTVGLTGGGLEATGGGSAGASIYGAIFTYSFGVNVGYQWLYFGHMDPETLKQGGFGIFGGYHLGGQGSNTWISVYIAPQCYAGYCSQAMTTTSQSSSFDFSQGPVLTFTFPKYNAGTAHLGRAYITFMALPTGNFFFASVSGGYSF
jgi:hypothetical protein